MATWKKSNVKNEIYSVNAKSGCNNVVWSLSFQGN
jgi:hypothetical protein